jgi:hypothetical protein
VSFSQSQQFSFSSMNLQQLPRFYLQSLHDFSLIINNERYDVNFSFLSCVSTKFQSLNKETSELICSVPPEHLECFCSFLSIFKGFPFYYENFNFLSLKFLIDFFGLSSLIPFIESKINFPTNSNEILPFIAESSYQIFENKYNHMLTIFIQNISTYSEHDLNLIPLDVLERIFSSQDLVIQNEDAIFALITNLINEDRNKLPLLKYIFFPAVSSHLMMPFFKKFPFEDLDFNFFETFKHFFECDVTKLNFDIDYKRWSDQPKFLTKNDFQEIFEIYDRKLQKDQNVADLIRLMIKDHQKLKNDFQNQNNEIENLKQENLKLKSLIEQKQLSKFLKPMKHDIKKIAFMR